MCNPVPGYWNLPHSFTRSTPGCTSQTSSQSCFQPVTASLFWIHNLLLFPFYVFVIYSMYIISYAISENLSIRFFFYIYRSTPSKISANILSSFLRSVSASPICSNPFFWLYHKTFRIQTYFRKAYRHAYFVESLRNKAITHHTVAKNCIEKTKLQRNLCGNVKSEPPTNPHPILAASILHTIAIILTKTLYLLLMIFTFLLA